MTEEVLHTAGAVPLRNSGAVQGASVAIIGGVVWRQELRS